jgi:CheY-like chemotaxis protein
MAKKVLIIEDGEFVQRTFVTVLSSSGYEVAVASNGGEGLRQALANPPDLILLDLMMPVLDGFKVLATLRENPTFAKTPVVVLSAKGAPEEIQKAISLGANDFLVKATTPPKKVLEKVKQFLP